MVKEYRLKNLDCFGFSVFTKSGETYVVFNGNKRRRGNYITDKKEMQDALEARAEFNTVYYLANEEENEAPVSVVEEKKDEAKSLELKSVKNLQEANAFIKERFGGENTFRSSSKAVEFCKENGVELVFDK